MTFGRTEERISWATSIRKSIYRKLHPKRCARAEAMLPFHLHELERVVHFSPQGVIHAGSHDGAEVALYDLIDIKQIHLFEPQAAIFKLLVQRYGNRGDIHLYQTALGSKDGVNALIHREKEDSPNRSSSASLLKPKAHVADYPYVQFEKTPTEEVEIRTLDSFQIEADFLVIDTQGYELEVLQGAKKTLQHIQWIIFEYWQNEAYENCAKENELVDFARDCGFYPVLKSFDRTFGNYLMAKKEVIR